MHACRSTLEDPTFALGALLFTITFALNIVAVRIVGRVRERYE